MKIGKANYGEKKEFKKTPRFDLKEEPLILRIFPPVGELADKGTWNVYHRVHWGFKNMEGKARPFESPLVKNRKTKMIEVPDAALERFENLSAQLLKARADGNGPLGAKLNSLVGYPLGVYSVNKGYYVIAMDLQGTIGTFCIKHKLMLSLKAEMDRLKREDGILDALDPENGCYFVFSKSNKGKDATFSANVYKEKVEVPGMGRLDKLVTSKLTDLDFARLQELKVDLVNMFLRPTSEQVAEIVKESDLMSGKSPAVDRYLNYKKKDSGVNGLGLGDVCGVKEIDAAEVGASSQANAALQAVQAAAAAQATPQAVPAAPPVSYQGPAEAPKTQAEQLGSLSDADFFKMIGNV